MLPVPIGYGMDTFWTYSTVAEDKIWKKKLVSLFKPFTPELKKYILPTFYRENA